jgi:hypothetical protein
MDGSHCAFGGGNNGQLGIWCDVAGGVDTLDTSLSGLIYPNQAAFFIQLAAEHFVQIACGFSPEVEEKGIGLQHVAVTE